MRTSLAVALGALAVGGALGFAMNRVFAHRRGLWDALAQPLPLPVVLVLPVVYLLLAMYLLAIVGPGLPGLIVVLGLVATPRLAAAIRGVVLARVAWGEDAAGPAPHDAYGGAAAGWGALFGLVLSQAGLLIAMESALTFVSVGVPQQTPSLVAPVLEATSAALLLWNYKWVWAAPALSIVLLVSGFGMMGGWLKDRASRGPGPNF